MKTVMNCVPTFIMEYFKAHDFDFRNTVNRLSEKKLTIGILIPVFNEEKTIGRIVSTFLNLKTRDLVKHVYVVDDGCTDDTIKVARKRGAAIVNRRGVGDYRYRDCHGKGFAIHDALSFIKEDIIIVYDGDVKNPSIDHIIGLSAPLVNDPELVLVKASFDRNLYLQNKVIRGHGGRMTELLIKPLIGYLFPDLVLFNQPTGGFYAVRREKIEEIEIFGELGADISVLINLYKKNGLKHLAEVFVGEIIHNNKTLDSLSKCASKQIQSLFYLNKGVDDFKNYSYFFSGKKIDVRSPLIILKPRAICRRKILIK